MEQYFQDTEFQFVSSLGMKQKEQIQLKPKKYAQEIEDRGFFIGLHTYRLEKNNLNYLINKLLRVSDFF